MPQIPKTLYQSLGVFAFVLIYLCFQRLKELTTGTEGPQTLWEDDSEALHTTAM